MQQTYTLPDDDVAFAHRMRQWAEGACSRWERAPDTTPGFLPRTTPGHRAEKQRDLEQLLRNLPDSKDRYEALVPGERARLRARVRGSIARSLSPAGGESVRSFFEECERVADRFVARAREFDPALPDRDIHQALRNQWVFNSIQALCDHPVSLTHSSFAYSMLYPLTDNRLDAPDHPAEERASLIRWLSSRLAGETMEGCGEENRSPIARLLDLIDAEFPRFRFPDVHRSLQAIHNAQKQALSLHGDAGQGRDAELLMLTLTKGGTSVLVDGYLVSGTLDETRGEAFFGYGVLLQLIDDLQDLEEDGAHGHSTPFRRAGAGAALESQTNKLLNFARSEFGTLERLATASWLPPLIEHSCTSLILEAIARYHRFYGASFLRHMEHSMPVPLGYLADLRERMHQRLEGWVSPPRDLA